ncbi:MAG: hypothetical protein AB7V13_18885 [Pseudorhodoplanes sp.]
MLLAVAGIIVLMTAATIAAAFFVFAPRIAEGRIIYDVDPDLPMGFGFKMAWLAVRTEDTRGVAAALGLAGVERVNWRAGLGTVYDDRLGETHVFVTPPVAGWTFVIGLPLPHPAGDSYADKMTPLLLQLSRRFGEAQYFLSFPPADHFAWARARAGRLVRAFAIAPAGVTWSSGHLTAEERAMGMGLFELRGVRGREGDAGGRMLLYPTERHVTELAGRWGLDPTRLDHVRAEPALGLIGIGPEGWRARRLDAAA